MKQRAEMKPHWNLIGTENQHKLTEKHSNGIKNHNNGIDKHLKGNENQ